MLILANQNWRQMVANTRRNKDIRKAVDNLIRVVHNTANSEGETLIAGNNSISTSNSISSNSSNSISSVTERPRHMIQASSRNFNRWDPMKNLEHHVNWHHFMNYKSLDTVLKLNVFIACCSDYVWYVRATWVSRVIASFFSLATGTEGVEITNKFFLQSLPL